MPSAPVALTDPSYTKITLHAGDFRATDNDHTLFTTILGSCIGVCLFDRQRRICGLNHFMLCNAPLATRPENLLHSEAGRYGVAAMELLINELMRLGAQRNNLRAKVFGGSSLLGQKEENGVGALNISFIRRFLKEERIPVEAESVGGEQGRVIYFLSDSYKVYVRQIPRRSNLMICEHERDLCRDMLKKQRQRSQDITLWD
ncbi:MAG: chemotaxis protein CheD [Desulfuromonadaceae bacterium]|nr:chemotaxis protein CheD [Desulfuromonadaceae bacterium]